MSRNPALRSALWSGFCPFILWHFVCFVFHGPVHFSLRTKLQAVSSSCQTDKIYVLERAEGHCYSAGGWPSSSKGGDTYADYFNFSCVWSYHHGYFKKQQPPLKPSDGCLEIKHCLWGQPLVAVFLFFYCKARTDTCQRSAHFPL